MKTNVATHQSKAKRIRVVLRQVAAYAAIAVLITILPLHSVVAATNDYNLDYTENDIQTYDASDQGKQCTNSTSTTTSSTPVGNFNPDPQAVADFESQIKPNMARLAPLYQQAAKAEGMADWQLLAGIHYEEFTLQTTNPTTNLGFRGIFQQSSATLSAAGIDPFGGPYATGKVLSDSDIVSQARDAIRLFIKGKAQASTVNVDVSKPLSTNDAMKLSIAYKSGEGSVWFTGGANPSQHAYTWAGFDSATHKLPMPWGAGSPYGDEVAGTLYDRPGTLTIWAILKSGNISTGGGTTNCTATTGAASINNVAWYSQRDPRWANEDFCMVNTDGTRSCTTFGLAGCYLTDLAMIATTLTGTTVYPDKIVPPNDIDIQPFAQKYGLKVQTTDFNGAKAALTANKGALVLVHGTFGGIFISGPPLTPSGHWVVWRGVDSSNALLINDPYDLPNNDNPPKPTTEAGTNRPSTNKAWDPKEFTDHADSYYVFTK